MATLRVKGQSVASMNHQRDTIRLGDRLLTIFEKSRRVGYLDSQIDKMIEWLDNNKDHPKWGVRETQRYRASSERNALVSELVEDGIAFDRQRVEMEDWVITEIQMALGVPVTAETATQIGVIARRWWGDKLFDVLSRYGARHYEMTEGVSE